MSIILFIIILAVLIFVHELGHFLTAKRAGIRVDEFGFGFPPRLWGKKVGETIYSINWIPFGGFVKIFGENPSDESDVKIETDRERNFQHKSKWIQAKVLVAGVTFNLIFAWILISLGFMTGLPTPVGAVKAGQEVVNPRLTLISIIPDSPAAISGLKSGDVVLELSSGNKILTAPSIEGMQDFVGASSQAIGIKIGRGDEIIEKQISPQAGIATGRRAIGVSLDMIGTLRLSVFPAIWEGAKSTVILTWRTAEGLGKLVLEAFRGQADFSQVAGPIGIVGLVGDAEALGLIYLLSFTAFISINLAVINLIPFPALDGGRLLMVLIEVIKGRPISAKITNRLNTVGFVLLLLLMAVVTYNDVARLF